MTNKDLKKKHEEQTEINNTITEMENRLKGTNSRITEAKEQINELETEW